MNDEKLSDEELREIIREIVRDQKEEDDFKKNALDGAIKGALLADRLGIASHRGCLLAGFENQKNQKKPKKPSLFTTAYLNTTRFKH